MYDAREKFLKDQQWALNIARDEGEARGRQLGILEGEARANTRMYLKGRINLLRQILKLPNMPDDEFGRHDEAGLKQLEAELQEQLRSRGTVI